MRPLCCASSDWFTDTHLSSLSFCLGSTDAVLPLRTADRRSDRQGALERTLLGGADRQEEKKKSRKPVMKQWRDRPSRSSLNSTTSWVTTGSRSGVRGQFQSLGPSLGQAQGRVRVQGQGQVRGQVQGQGHVRVQGQGLGQGFRPSPLDVVSRLWFFSGSPEQVPRTRTGAPFPPFTVSSTNTPRSSGISWRSGHPWKWVPPGGGWRSWFGPVLIGTLYCV